MCVSHKASLTLVIYKSPSSLWQDDLLIEFYLVLAQQENTKNEREIFLFLPPLQASLFCGHSFSHFFVIRRDLESNTPLTPRSLRRSCCLEKGNLCPEFWRKRRIPVEREAFGGQRELLCVSGVDGRLGLYSYAVARQWSGLWCGNTGVPDIMVLQLWSSLVKGSFQIQMDQIGLGSEHLSSNYDRIKTEGLFPSFPNV